MKHPLLVGIAIGIVIGWFFHRELQDLAFDIHFPRPKYGGL